MAPVGHASWHSACSHCRQTTGITRLRASSLMTWILALRGLKVDVCCIEHASSQFLQPVHTLMSMVRNLFKVESSLLYWLVLLLCNVYLFKLLPPICLRKHRNEQLLLFLLIRSERNLWQFTSLGCHKKVYLSDDCCDRYNLF